MNDNPLEVGTWSGADEGHATSQPPEPVRGRGGEHGKAVRGR